MSFLNFNPRLLLYSLAALFIAPCFLLAQASTGDNSSSSENPLVISLTQDDGDIQEMGCTSTATPLPGPEHEVPVGSTIQISLIANQVHQRAYTNIPAYDFVTTWSLDNDYNFFPNDNNYALWSELLSHDPTTDKEVIPFGAHDAYTTTFLFTFQASQEGYTELHFRRHQTLYNYNADLYFNIHVVPATSTTSQATQL